MTKIPKLPELNIGMPLTTYVLSIHKWLEEVREIYQQELNCCRHPGCCCVCGHKKQCPEDGPIAFGGTLD